MKPTRCPTHHRRGARPERLLPLATTCFTPIRPTRAAPTSSPARTIISTSHHWDGRRIGKSRPAAATVPLCIGCVITIDMRTASKPRLPVAAQDGNTHEVHDALNKARHVCEAAVSCERPVFSVFPSGRCPGEPAASWRSGRMEWRAIQKHHLSISAITNDYLMSRTNRTATGLDGSDSRN